MNIMSTNAIDVLTIVSALLAAILGTRYDVPNTTMASIGSAFSTASHGAAVAGAHLVHKWCTKAAPPIVTAPIVTEDLASIGVDYFSVYAPTHRGQPQCKLEGKNAEPDSLSLRVSGRPVS